MGTDLEPPADVDPWVVRGRAIAPGLACGPLVRNHARLTPQRARDSILVAERAVPDDVARIRAAAGTVTLAGAALSHVSLLSREFGRPSVALDPSQASIVPRGAPVLRLSTTAKGVARSIAALRGDVLMIDGDRGIVKIPGARSRAARSAIRRAHDALRRFAESGDEDALRLADPSDPAIARFLLEAGTLYRALPPGGARRRLRTAVAGALGEDAASRLARGVVRDAVASLDHWCRAASASVSSADDAEELDRLRREAAERSEAAARLSRDLGEPPSAGAGSLERLLRRIDSRRRELDRALETEIEEALGLDAVQRRTRAGKLRQLLRRARASGLQRGRIDELRRALASNGGPLPRSSEGPLVLPLAGSEADRDLLGGKAAGLLELGPALPDGCLVPEGFVVTTAAYRRHLLGEAGSRLDRAVETSSAPRELSRLARAAIWSGPLPSGLAAAVAENVRSLPAGPLALRSSTPLEGGAAGSLAGLLDTYLGVVGADAVLGRIRGAWSSLWDSRVLAVLAGAGVSPLAGAVAVLVQRMIETRVAGVLFTRDPAGTPDTMMVNAAWGLGEGIRSGEIRGDLVRLRRGSGNVVTAELAAGRSQIVLDARGAGTVERKLPARRQGRRCLEEHHLARLAEMARALEAATGRGQDVEFGFDDAGLLWVFQIRRATGHRAGNSQQRGSSGA